MAKKSCALIGPGLGPDVRLAGVPSRMQVRGLCKDEVALIFQRVQGAEDITLGVQEDGIYDLIECGYVGVSYEGENPGFIACALIGGGDAL